MSALRVDIVSGTLGDTSVPFTLMLDCYKAELVIVAGGPDWSINGVVIPQQLFADLTGANSLLPLTFEFGGMMRDGRPVNLNQNLTFTNVVAPGRLLHYMLTRTYLDADLNDPQKR